MEDLRCFSLHFFFEIKDAELYGGKGTTGYAEMTYDKATNAESFTADGYIEHSKTNAQILANQLNVPIENITPIHRDKYEEMTGESNDTECSFCGGKYEFVDPDSGLCDSCRMSEEPSSKTDPDEREADGVGYSR